MAMGALQSTTSTRIAAIEARAWALAQRIGIFGYAEIAAELSISMEAATKIVRGWESEGRISIKSGGNASGRKRFAVAADHRPPQGRVGAVAQQLWQSMRGLKQFSPVDLAAHCRADLGVTPAEASEYCQALLRAGYLRVARLAAPPARPAIYALIRNTGPRAPRERRVR
ncbi:MAG: hypothetical protein Q7J57_16515, partial [Gemmobacter sp.]|nr:hypothetical protein [Gemmobacter sp.]